MKKGIATLTCLAFAIGLYCLAPINNPPGATGSTGAAGSPGASGSPGISGSPGPAGSPGPIATPTPAYLVYTALLTQTGTDAPVATVQLPNTIGVIVWTYVGSGDYIGTLNGVFTNNKTTVEIASPAQPGGSVFNLTEARRESGDVIAVRSRQASIVIGSMDVPLTDGILSGEKIEIRVYP